MTRSQLRAVWWAVALLFAPALGWAKECRVEGVKTFTGNVHDVLATPGALWVASDGGVEEFDRKSLRLLRKYTHLDGLSSPQVFELSRSERGSIRATLDGAVCELRGERFECSPVSQALDGERLRFAYHRGARISATTRLSEGTLVGTAGAHAYMGSTRLGTPELPDRHITSLAVFGERLWVGTFNGGLAREDSRGQLAPVSGPGKLVNALQAGSFHLFVGTSQGLFKTKDGRRFDRVEMVEQAVVGLAFDGTSIWASTPGALYRIKDGKGPPSDVWWLPGGSRSLQKVSAVPGYVWLGTEDRGAVSMKVGPRTVSSDKPFTVYDRGTGLASSWSLAVAARPGGSAWMTTLREGVTFIPMRGEATPVETGVSDWGLSALAVSDGVWIGSQDGATFLSNDGERSTKVQGLPDARVHAFFVDPRQQTKGRLWIGTENGLAWCSPR